MLNAVVDVQHFCPIRQQLTDLIYKQANAPVEYQFFMNLTDQFPKHRFSFVWRDRSNLLDSGSQVKCLSAVNTRLWQNCGELALHLGRLRGLAADQI